MTLRWDPLLVRALAQELDARFRGSHVRALRLDGAARRFDLLLDDATLSWSLHPAHGAVLVLPAADPGEGDLPFRARVRGVRSLPDERLLVVETLPRKGGGARDLVVELLGNQWNALVVERPSGTVRHVLVRREGPRPARVGAPYAAPPPSPRLGVEPEALTEEAWMALLAPVPPAPRARTLVAEVAWTSPLVAPALLEGDGDPSEVLRKGYARWRALAGGGRAPSPTLLRREGGAQPYPWPLPGWEAGPCASLLEAFARAAREGSAGGAEPAEPGHALVAPPLLDRLERALDHHHRRATRLEAELAGLEDEGALRAEGDLLLARFDAVPAGAARVTLTGFDGAPITLELDPGRPVHENARARYERANRVGRARERLPTLLAAARQAAARLESLLTRARAGEAVAAEIQDALPAARAVSRGGAPTAAPLPYRVFRSSGGLEIRVGRGARANDDLTFRHSAPGDVWLHARDAAGAHVVLRWQGPGNPPSRDLLEAAALAALHSRARTSGSAPVDWTLRKYVRKPRGAAAGAVIPDRVKTVMVRPDAALLERLAVSDVG